MSGNECINRKAFIPGAITSLNMFYGFLAIHFAMQGKPVAAGWWIVLAACMDGLDGKIARILNASSKFGKEYDSLADVVSFGLAPAVLILSLNLDGGWLQVVLAFMLLLAGACRLARYNCQKSNADRKGFTGMPIPAAAIIVATCVIFSHHQWGGMRHPGLLYGLIVTASVLMVSVIRYDSFPNMTERTLKSNVLLGLFITCLALLARFPNTFFFLFMLGYIAFGLVRWAYIHFHEHVPADDDDEEIVPYED